MELTYKVTFSKKASKDRKELIREGYEEKLNQIFSELAKNPLAPPSKPLRGEAAGLMSRRLNVKDRIVYEVKPIDDPSYDGEVVLIRLRTHYKGVIPLFLLRVKSNIDQTGEPLPERTTSLAMRRASSNPLVR